MSRLQKLLTTVMGGKVDPAAILAGKLTPSPTNPDIAVIYRTPTDGNFHDMCQRIDDTYYMMWSLLSAEDHTLRQIRLGVCTVKVPITTVGAITLNGANWTGPLDTAGNDPTPISAKYYRTATAAEYAQFATPAGTTIVGIVGYVYYNAGLSLVTIDGDNTLANLCYTAQDLVTAGTFPNTILVANGGSLNPTDRVLDWYGTLQNERVILSDNLTAGAHTVRLTCTGYEREASDGARLYVSGYLYGGPAITTATANTDISAVTSYPEYLGIADSVLEYALSTTITTAEWVGCGHGNETVTSLKVYIDGTETAMSSEYTPFHAATSLRIERLANMTHPDVAPALIGASVMNYTLTQNSGVKVTIAITTADDFTVTGYMPMLAFRDVIDTASFDAASLDYNVAGNPGGVSVDTGNCRAKIGYAWDADGTMAIGVYVPSLASIDNYATSSALAYIQDRTGGVFNKFYFERWSATAIATGTVIASEFYYFLKRFPAGAAASLAR